MIWVFIFSRVLVRKTRKIKLKQKNKINEINLVE